MFLPVFSAQVNAENPVATFEGQCFEKISFKYEKVSETAFNVHVNTADPRSHLCNEVILFANTEIRHFEVFFFHGTKKIRFEMNTPEA